MGLRDFDIPFGPDRTGGMDPVFANPPAEEEPAADPFGEPQPTRSRMVAEWEQPEPAADPAFTPAFDPTFDDLEVITQDSSTLANFDAPKVEPLADFTVPAVATAPQQQTVKRAQLTNEDWEDEAEQTSFAALRSSIGQGRELKARARELEEFSDQLSLDKEELRDRENILGNYEALIAEQDEIIADATTRREAEKSELASIATEIEATEDELAAMRDYHNEQMQPLETELGRARAGAEQAKNDERSRKSELNSAESELRKASSNADATMLRAKVARFHEEYEHAQSFAVQAQDVLDEVKRIYDDAVAAIESREGPLERAIEDLEQREADLKDSIADLGEEISTAKKRRAYCESVMQYPDETRKLRDAVAQDQETLEIMQQDYDELSEILRQTRTHARKAKAALIAIGVLVVVCLVVLVSIFIRG